MCIRDAPVSDEQIWYRNLLLGILNSSLLDYGYVKIGAIQKSPYLAAWSCRNLLELKVITKYVLASAQNAIDFKNDLVVDAKEFFESISKRHSAMYPKLLSDWRNAIEEFESPIKEAMEAGLRREIERGPRTEATDEEAETYRRLMIQFGISASSKAKRSGEIAKLISQSEEFHSTFKFCSKIMHRTALSIASTVIPGALDEIVPLLLSIATGEMLAIHGLISRHFEHNGIQPPGRPIG